MKLKKQGFLTLFTAFGVFAAFAVFTGTMVMAFVVIVPEVYSEALASEARERLMERGIASFSSFERAAKTLKKLADYYQFRKEQSQGKGAG